MLHRPYIRQEVRQEVENRAQKNNKGQFLDANTHKPINGKYDLGHKPGHEFWYEEEKAEKEGLDQEQFNTRMNNPDFYQIEDPHENRSHSHEMPRDQQVRTENQQNASQSKKGSPTKGKNGFLDGVKADKAKIDRSNQVSRNAAQNENAQFGKKSGIDSGGRGRGDTGPMGHGQGAAHASSGGHGGH